MTLPASGAITLNNVNVELGLSGTTSINMDQSTVRTLFTVPSGAISMSNGYGKSNAPTVSSVVVSGTTSYNDVTQSSAAWTVLITYSNASTSTDCTLLTWGQYYNSSTLVTSPSRTLVVATASVTLSSGITGNSIGTSYIKATDATSGVYGQLTVTWTCLPLTTLITMADGSQKQMGDIQVGDMVRAVDQVTGEVSNEPVTFVLETNTSYDLIRIECEDGIVLEPTPEHEVWIRRDGVTLWSQAKDVLLHDEMLSEGLTYKKVISAAPINYPEGIQVGNISVANAKVYFAERLLMHNTGL